MKRAILLTTFLPFFAFCQYDEELGYMPPAEPVDSSKPVLHFPSLSFGLVYNDRYLDENPSSTLRATPIHSIGKCQG